MRRLPTRGFSSLALAAGLAACGPLPGQAPPPIAPGLSKSVDQALCQLGFTRVPLREARTGHHLVDVTINGRPATFIVDTGANVTVLNAELAEPFALTPRVGVVGAAVGIGGSLGAKQWTVKTLAVGGVPVRQNHIATADLSGVVGALSRMTDAQVAGIVGQDVLKAQQAVIDVDGPTLHMLQTGAAPRPPQACEGEAALRRGGTGTGYGVPLRRRVRRFGEGDAITCPRRQRPSARGRRRLLRRGRAACARG